MSEDPTLVDQVTSWAMNHPVLGVLVAFGIFVIGLATFTDALGKLWSFGKGLLSSIALFSNAGRRDVGATSMPSVSTSSSTEAQINETTASDGSAIIQGDINVGGDFSVIAGLTPLQLAELAKSVRGAEDAHPAAMAAIKQVSEELGVAKSAVRDFLETLDVENVPIEKWGTVMREIAKNYRAMKDELSALRPGAPAIALSLVDVGKAIDEGDYDRADELLERAEVELLRLTEK